MSFSFQIQNSTLIHEIWGIMFACIASLGIYISLILLVRDRCRGSLRCWLGFYTASLSLLLLDLVFLNSDWGNEWLNSMGIVLLFFIGPFFFQYRKASWHQKGLGKVLIHLLPGGLVFFCMGICNLGDTVWYVCGLIHAGIYLLIPLLIPGQTDLLLPRHGILQLLLYTGICITSLAIPRVSVFIFSSVGLAILILHIWVRLLYAAYLSYMISKS